jgi:hypothetical protein
MRSLIVVVAACLAGCHLAADPDAPTCAQGTHPFGGRCVADETVGPVIAIAPGDAGADSCAVSPDSITVAPNGPFSFENRDAVDHVITGEDGTPWTTAVAGRSSGLVTITKVGVWRYRVSGCAQGGSVVVE